MKKIFEKKDKRSELEKQYDKEVKKLGTLPSGTKEYDTQLAIVERLSTLLSEEKKTERKISPDTVVNGMLNAVEFGWLVSQPYLDNVKARALNMISRGRGR